MARVMHCEVLKTIFVTGFELLYEPQTQTYSKRPLMDKIVYPGTLVEVALDTPLASKFTGELLRKIREVGTDDELPAPEPALPPPPDEAQRISEAFANAEARGEVGISEPKPAKRNK